jgi:hypothetical protein
MHIVFCDNHLLVVSKPAGISTQPHTIPSSVENSTFDKASAPGLQQAKPMSKQPMCKHMGDADSCKDGDDGAVKSGVFNRTWYKTVLPKEQWIYEYGLLNQWGNFAFALQKFSESIEAFEQLLLKQNVPKEICMDAIRKIQQAKKMMVDLNRFGLPSF